MTKTTEAKWRRLIAAQSRSGLTVREFAAAEGIGAATLYWWRSKLRRDGREGTTLVPVEVIERSPQMERGAATDGFELQIDGAMTLRVPARFDEAELRRLIRALRC
jgi:transposase-like protein